MGSRACAANHYVIVEKCSYLAIYLEMYVHIFGERRFSEQVPIWGSIYLSEFVVTHTKLLKINIYILFTRSEHLCSGRLFQIGDFLTNIVPVKLKVNIYILSLSNKFVLFQSLIVYSG